MKRFFQYASGLLIICLFSTSVISAQETKKEKKIKIIVNDESGTKVVIDTVFTTISDNDPVIMKDGEVIVFTSPGGITHRRSGSGRQEVTVNVESAGDNPGDITKTITIINSDSLKAHSDGKGKVMIVSTENHENKGKSDNHYVITRSGSSKKEAQGNVYFYSNDNKNEEKDITEKYEVVVDTDDRNEMSDTKVRYVVAKNGMVVTIEGNDEVKAKELFNEIEKKLGEGTGTAGGKEKSGAAKSKPAKK